MVPDQSIWVYFADASVIVKIVMLMLLAASVMSWTIIFQRGMSLKKAKEDIIAFEDEFWSGVELSKLYAGLTERRDETEGLASIFQAGFREFIRLRKQGASADAVMEGAQRAMRIARSHEMDKLEQHLSFLATVGSTSPYIGLFGTVWGIMTSFHALGASQQAATISMVAPGISEALVATAMGLFAAIPAVIFYNRYANEVERLLNHYDTFQEEFSTILYRQAHANHAHHEEAVI